MKQSLNYSYHNVTGRAHIPERMSGYTEMLADIASMKSGEYVTHEHSLRLPLDTAMLAEVKHQVERYFTTSLRYVVVVGIGGSNLGTQAIYDAIRRERDGVHEGYPQIIFLDTVSTKLILDIERILELDVSYPEEIVVNLISKSGGTTESIANFELLYGYLLRRFPKIKERIIVTTDHNSQLWKAAEKEGLGVLPIPKLVGGRYSVFTPVGLFPLALVGVDIQELLLGAKDFLRSNFSGENHSLRLAETIFRAHHDGAKLCNFFFFNPELESVGKWARQLYAESLGKEHDKTGKVVHSGLTPIVSIGSTDLHSVGQLYFGGPKDKFTLITYVKSPSRLVIPKDGLFTSLVPGIGGRSPDEIMQAIYGGTVIAYNNHKLPYGEVMLPDISPYSLGMFLEWQMISVMYLAELFHVDAFDQPNVEDYKKVMRDILNTQNHK
jgi:glucose-6-phosphate isomerase